MRRTGRRCVAAAVALVAMAVSLLAAVPAHAQTSDPELVIRSIDGTDRAAVETEFLWTGDRAQVPELVVRENGTVVDSSLPVRLDDQRDFGIVLAIDTSGSMEEGNAFQTAIDAATSFVEAKEQSDQIAVVGFGSAVEVFAPLTADESTLVDALGRMGVGGGTPMYDAVQKSVDLFDGTDLVPNIVLLTDGRDEGSTISEDAAVNLLGRSDALLYGLGIDSGDFDPASLERLASATGGSVLTSDDPDALSGFYDDVQERLRQQFSASFESATDAEGAATVTLTIGATSDEGSYTPGSVASTVGQLEPVEIAQEGGISALQSTVFLWVAIGLLVVAVAVAVFAFGMSVIGDKRSLDRVLQPYSDGFVAPDDAGDDRLATSAILQRAVAMTGQLAERRGVLRRIEDMLERANLPLRAAEALFFYIVAAVLLGVIGGLLLGGVIGGIFILILAFAIPPGIVVALAHKRRAAFQTQLPDLLALLASTLRSGYSLMQGVEAAAQEVIEPTRRELQRVVTEARLGMPLEEALHNVSMRMNSRDFEWTVMAIAIQREVGGNLAELLDTVADTMRARDRLRRDINSLTAEGRVSAIVLGILPVAIGFMIYALNPEYIEGLFDETVGWIMVIGAGGLMLGGFVWMYKIIDIEV
ncbi:MAG: type II secretion system F family protein [Acidimicrobiales bacterium]|nr:type II secretion system F family protein [Acidimicrobiales bacterium]